MLVGVTTQRWPRRTRGAELALGVAARGLVPFVARRAEVRVVNVAVHEIALTRFMDGHGEKLQRVAQRRTAARRYLVNRFEERITTAAKRSSALSGAWHRCRSMLPPLR